ASTSPAASETAASDPLTHGPRPHTGVGSLPEVIACGWHASSRQNAEIAGTFHASSNRVETFARWLNGGRAQPIQAMASVSCSGRKTTLEPPAGATVRN